MKRPIECTNALKSILKRDFYIWRSPDAFKSELQNAFDEDKLHINVIMQCLEEEIPDYLLNRKEITALEKEDLAARLERAYGCRRDIAEEAVSIWIGAFGIVEDNRKILLDDLFGESIGVRTYNCLRRAGIRNLGDIANLTYDGLSKVRNLGRKSTEEVLAILQEYGLELKKEENSLDEALNTVRENAKEIQSGIDGLTRKINDISMSVELQAAGQYLEEGNYRAAVSALESAVDLGFKGNYAIIGMLYLTGEHGIKVDLSKGFKWLSRFYDDYKSGSLNLGDDKGCLVDVCYNLGICYLWCAQEDSVSELSKIKLDRTLELWREAISIADDCKTIDSQSAPGNLFAMGCCLHYGEIHSEDHDDLPIEKDYDYAMKALTKAASLGYADAYIPLADMYENGNGVEVNIRMAEKYYVSAAILKNKDGVDWCQKHFIEALPWEKKDDWSDIDILSIHGYPKCTWFFLKAGIKNVQECRTGLFDRLSQFSTERGHVNLICLGLRALKEYMEKC